MVDAESYARWRATPLGAVTERVELEAVLALLGPLEGKRLLDVGAGDGSYSQKAQALGARVTAVDLQRSMLEAGRARGLGAHLVQGRAEALPFADESFDLVVAVTVLCFVPAAEAAVRELARVLAPGGRLVLGELGRYSLWAAERRLRGWLGSSTWRSARFWSHRDLAQLAQGAGLQPVARRDRVYFPPWGPAARLLAPVDPLLGRLRSPGAAFLAVAADKPRP